MEIFIICDTEDAKASTLDILRLFISKHITKLHSFLPSFPVLCP